MTDTPDPTESIPDVTWDANGTIRIRVDGRTLRVRRPKLGELRRLRESVHELNDANVEGNADLGQLGKDIAARQTWLTDKVGVEPPSPLDEFEGDETRALERFGREQLRAITAEAEDRRLTWTVEALDLLCDGKVPDPDDLPPWAASAAFLGHLMAHWQAVPLPSGAPGR